MKIIIITGTRPQLIKTALLDKRLRQEHDVKIVHTGQHYDPEMSGNFFKELDIPEPDRNLGIGNLPPHIQAGRMTERIGTEIINMQGRSGKIDLVIVIGDTSSALGGALAASKLHIPIAHVEAGCRCGDRGVPEEINRILVDHMSDLLFTPTLKCQSNLCDSEGISSGVNFTGDVLYDTYLHYTHSNEVASQDHIFVTIHREANTDNEVNLFQILEAVDLLAMEHGVIFPAHPRTRKAVAGDWSLPIPPIGYLQTLYNIRSAKLVITDSGGVQREAYFSKVPCIYIGTAGWPELYNAGASEYVPADTEAILEAVRTFTKPQFPGGILGDGNAVEKIAEVIRDYQC